MKVSKVSVEEWNAFIKSCPSACFYQSPQWYQVWENTVGIPFECLEYKFSNGNRYFFPRQIRKRLFGLTKEYLSGPVGTYGGFIGLTTPSETESEILINSLESIKHLTFVQSPHFQLKYSQAIEKGNTRIVHLNKLVAGNITSNWPKTGRKNHKLSQGNNFTFSNTFDQNKLQSYFNIYQQSIERWGHKASNNYTYNLFQNIFNTPNNSVELLYLESDQEMVCGGIFFKHNNIVNWWHGALSENFTSTGAVYLFQEMVMNYFSTSYTKYDLGFSGGHKGVDDFKRRIGSITYPAQIIEKKPAIFKFFNK